MEAFLMLGIVPGTSIQISFEAWLYAVIILSVVLLCVGTLRKQRLTACLIALTIHTAKPALLQA